MSRPTPSQADGWRPGALRRLAGAWESAAAELRRNLDAARADVSHWSGSAANAARDRAARVAAEGDALALALVTAAGAARDGAARIAEAQAAVAAVVSAARGAGFAVSERGLASPLPGPAPPSEAAATATEWTARIGVALDRLGDADTDAARQIDAAFGPAHLAAAGNIFPADTGVGNTFPAGTGHNAEIVAGWPAMTQARIAAQIAVMTPEQRRLLVEEFPRQVGNTDGVPWDLRLAANRINIAQAVAAETSDDPQSKRRAAFYRTLLDDIDDPTRTGLRIPRQILAFDPARASLVELNGNLASATSVAVLVPGMNTTIEGSAANTETARRFVQASRGEVAMITYLGGPFPGGNLVTGLADAANPRYALDMAPRLVAFSEDVDRTVDAAGRTIPVTYIGHSYGGSIVGTAEALGLTSDRTLFVAAAGAGVGVDDPGDWHNRNPHVVRFSMTAPGDFIQAVQGIPGGPHGADPDVMPGVIRLSTGHYDDGRLMAGASAHSDVLNRPSDAWRNVLAVITGDSETLHTAG